MKEYWVWWHYWANYCEPFRVQAESMDDAGEKCRKLCGGDDFKKHATIYVVEAEPKAFRPPKQ